MKREMTAETLVGLYKDLEAVGLRIWIDGGWGVDALLRRQTRAHEDVDFVVEENDLAELVALLRARGYDDIPRDDTRSWNFVLGDDAGSDVDLHVVVFDAQGNGIYGPPENGESYPAYSFGGRGRINGHEVLCMSVEFQVINHTGYKPRDKDVQDMQVLCAEFGLEPPEEYVGLM